MRLAIELDHEEIQGIGYPIVVEGWDKRLSGRVKRAWLQEFDEKERRAAAETYKRFYDWYLVRGAPETCLVRPEQLQAWQKLVNFFGGI